MGPKLRIEIPEKNREEISKKVQKKLFSMGYSWSGQKALKYLDKKFISLWEHDTGLSHGHNPDIFPESEKVSAEKFLGKRKTLFEWLFGG